MKRKCCYKRQTRNPNEAWVHYAVCLRTYKAKSQGNPSMEEFCLTLSEIPDCATTICLSFVWAAFIGIPFGLPPSVIDREIAQLFTSNI